MFQSRIACNYLGKNYHILAQSLTSIDLKVYVDDQETVGGRNFWIQLFFL